MTGPYKSAAGAERVLAQYRTVLSAWPTANQQRMIPTRHGDTFVLTCGKADGPPLVLLHGAQANAASWMFDAVVWSRRFRVIAFDRLGDAGLSAPNRLPLDSDAHAAWLDEILTALDVHRADFVGVSLGGWFALDYAVRRPDRVNRLVLVCPAGVGRQKNLLLRVAPLLLLGAWGQNKVRELVFGPRPKSLPVAIKPLAELMSLIGQEYRPHMVKIPRLSDAQLAGLAVPILAIVGGRDVMLDSVETRERLTRLSPRATVDFLPEARHFIPGQAERIAAFLEAD